MAGKAQQHPPTLSDQVRQAVRDSGRLQSDLALQAGISRPRLSRFLNHGEGLTTAKLDALVRELGLELKPAEKLK